MSLKSQELFTHSVGNGMVCYVEREVDKIDYEDLEIVPIEMFSSTGFPAVTLNSGSIVFNTCAIKSLDKCKHIKILIRSDKKFMLVIPCEEGDKDALQWCRFDPNGKVKPRAFSGKFFASLLCNYLKRDFHSTVKLKGTLIEEEGEKLLAFSLTDEKVPKHRFLLFMVDMLN